MKKEINQAIKILKEADRDYIKSVLEREKENIIYDFDYQGYCVNDEYVIDYFFKNENTYLNPKELESMIEEIIENEMFPIQSIAYDFIEYYEMKWGLDHLTVGNIDSKIIDDAEFHIFAQMGLLDEVIKQLKERGIEIKE